MHNLNLHMSGCEGTEYLLFSNSHWQNLIDKVGLPDLKALENYILSANDNYRGVIPSLALLKSQERFIIERTK